MNTVVIDNVTYTRASVLARQFGYTSDYLGQLCRAKKVNCQLVGRTWYIEESTIENHKSDRYKSLRSNEITSKINVRIDSDDIEKGRKVESVSPVLSKKTQRAVGAIVQTKKFLGGSAAAISYESDAADLYPRGARKISPILPSIQPQEVMQSAPRPVHVHLEGAIPLKIRLSEQSESSLEFTDLPEVPLSGALRVTAVDDYFVDVPQVDYLEQAKVPIPAEHTPRFLKGVDTRKRQLTKGSAFVPQSIQSPVPTVVSWRLVGVSCLLAIGCAGLMVSVDSYTLSNGAATYSGLVLNPHPVLQFFGL